MSHAHLSRRHFFFGSLLAGAVPAGGFGSTPSLKALGYKSPNEKLNIASIGAGGKAESDITGCETENIVALCDVDSKNAERMFAKYEKPPKYKDFRVMLDKESKNIDAVIVTIPDFMHATAAIWAMERGKHVYVQKPLTHTVWECARAHAKPRPSTKSRRRWATRATRTKARAQCAEMIWSGEIGNVTEVHAWTNRPIWPQGMPNPAGRKARARHAGLGPVAGHPEHAPLQHQLICRSPGAACWISAAARWATWPATFWARRIWRCNWARRPASSAPTSKARAITTIRRNRPSGSTSLPAAPCRP